MQIVIDTQKLSAPFRALGAKVRSGVVAVHEAIENRRAARLAAMIDRVEALRAQREEPKARGTSRLKGAKAPGRRQA